MFHSSVPFSSLEETEVLEDTGNRGQTKGVL